LKKRVEALKVKEALNRDQVLSVESSRSKLKPLSPNLLSRKSLLSDTSSLNGQGFEKDDKIPDITTPRK
jgi:hypothetical protein